MLFISLPTSHTSESQMRMDLYMLHPQLANSSTLPLITQTELKPRDYPADPSHGPTTAHYLRCVVLTKAARCSIETSITEYAPSSSASPPTPDFIVILPALIPSDPTTITDYALNSLAHAYERKQILDFYRVLFEYISVRPEDLDSWRTYGMEVLIKNCLAVWDEWWAGMKGVTYLSKTDIKGKGKEILAKKAEDAWKMPPPPVPPRKRTRFEMKKEQYEQRPVTRGRRSAFSLGPGENLSSSLATGSNRVGLGFGTHYGAHTPVNTRPVGSYFSSKNKRSGHVFDYEDGWQDEKYPVTYDDLDRMDIDSVGVSAEARAETRRRGLGWDLPKLAEGRVMWAKASRGKLCQRRRRCRSESSARRASWR